MSLDNLAQAGRTPTLPYRVELDDGCLDIQQWHRVLPGRRYVGRANWQGRSVLAKIFVGRHALRHYQRELAGVEKLAAQAVSTPKLVATGLSATTGWILFEYLENAQTLAQRWQDLAEQLPLNEAQTSLLASALGQLAALHQRGLYQSDLHLDNFLQQADQLYVIDGDGVQQELPGQPLSRATVLKNLGMFFAQLPASFDPFLEELLIHYLLVNGEHALPLQALQQEIDRVRRWRVADVLAKSLRDCSLFSVHSSAFGLQAVRRAQAEVLAPLLQEPDRFVQHGQLCKAGGSATVARVELAGRNVLLKRYNIKGFGHWLRRCWRPSRAVASWQAGLRLELLGIATAKPLAIREERRFGLRGRAWLVTEYLAAEDALQHLAPFVDSGMPQAELEALVRLFEALQRARISHGDLKGTNLFWSADRWSLIDLDSMVQHRHERSFKVAHAKDRQRLLRNWPVSSVLYQQLSAALPEY